MALDFLINYHAKYRPNHTALIFDNKKYSWQEFAKLVNTVSNALLANGIKKNDKVAMVLPNTLELITLYWAVSSIAAVVVPLSPLLQAKGLVNLLKNSDSVMVFLLNESYKNLQKYKVKLPKIKKYIVCDAENVKNSFQNFTKNQSAGKPLTTTIYDDDLFNIIFSSGTTGKPKGIEHSHQVRTNYCLCFAHALRMNPESVVLHSGSIVFNGAFVDMMPAFYLGATYVLLANFDAEKVINIIKKHQVTHTIMVPTQIIALLQSPNATLKNLNSIEMIMNIGAPLSEQYKKELAKLLPNRFYELYGLTEGFVTILDKNDASKKIKSVGSPPLGFEMKIVDNEGREKSPGEIGEIVGKGPIVMNGYYKNPQLTKDTLKNGWIHTGDLGFVDEDGFLYLAGREKDMIISGGVNVYPTDIEEIINNHSDVLESAVIGIESLKWGEVPIAYVVLKSNKKVDKEKLLTWVNERVDAKYQRLENLVFLDEFPRNVAGKILKNKLSEIYDANK